MELQDEWDETDRGVLETKLDEYELILHDVGSAQKVAAKWHDAKIDIERDAAVAQHRADARFKLANYNAQECKRRQEAEVLEPKARLANVRMVERERANLVATLPKPDDPLDYLKPDDSIPQPPILVYDVAAKDTIRTKFVSNCQTLVLDHSVPGEVDLDEDGPGVSAAQLEQVRLDAQQKATCLRAQENVIKADLRGNQAVKRERVRRHYQMLLAHLDEVGRGDARQRNQIEASRSRGPNEVHVTNRRLEKVFEEEMLHQLAGAGNRGSVLQNSIKGAAHPSSFITTHLDGPGESENEAVTETSEWYSSTERVQRNISKEIQQLRSDTSNENVVEPGLSGDNWNALPTKKLAWAATSVLESTSEPSAMPHETDASTGSVALDDNSRDATSKGAAWATIGAPFEKLRDDGQLVPPSWEPRITSTLDETTRTSVDESSLGPGERPLMPNIRRPRFPSASQPLIADSWPFSTTLNIDATDSEAAYRSSRRNGDLCISERSESVRSIDVSTDLSRRQRELDEELASIDERLAKLRMAAVPDLVHRPPVVVVAQEEEEEKIEREASASRQSSRGATPVMESTPALTQPPPPPPPLTLVEREEKPRVKRLTPRDTYVVEGRAAGDKDPWSESCSPSSESHQLPPAAENDEASEVLTVAPTPRPHSRASSIGRRSLLRDLSPACRGQLSALVQSQLSTRTGSVATSASPTAWSETGTSGGESIVTHRSVSSGAADTLVGPNSESNSSVLSNPPVSTCDNSRRMKLCSMEATGDHTLYASQLLSTAPRFSLSNVPSEENAVLRSITHLANRLAQTALLQATSELGSHEPATTRQPTSSTSPTPDSPPTPSECNQILESTRNTMTPASNTDSYKAELRARLTSSLISTLHGATTLTECQTDNTTIVGSTVSQLMRRLLQSSSGPQLDITEGTTSAVDRLLCDSDDPSQLIGASTIAQTITSPSSVRSSEQPNSSDILSNSPSTGCDAATLPVTLHLEAGDSCIDAGEQTTNVQQMKRRILTDYVKVNKDWLLSLASQPAKSQLGSYASSVSHSSLSSGQSTTSPVFQPLSPTDVESDASPTLTGTPSEQSRVGINETVPRPPPVTHWNSYNPPVYRPLPRLTEAPSEESLPDHTPAGVVSHWTRSPDSAFQTTPPSWSGSQRRLSDDSQLLSARTTSNSNLTPHYSELSELTPVATTANNSLSTPSSIVIRTTPASNDTTLQQLRSHMPATPTEPEEPDVATCLGTNGSSIDGGYSPSGPAKHPHSLVQELLETTAEDGHWRRYQPPLLMMLADQSHEDPVPPGMLGTQTRTTTTIDSSLVWDSATMEVQEPLPSKPPESLGNIFLLPFGTDPRNHRQYPPREPRPTSPADGCAARTLSPVDVKPHKPGGLYQSMPTILVDCDDSDTSSDLYRAPYPYTTTAAASSQPLCASWNNFDQLTRQAKTRHHHHHYEQTPINSGGPSISDSLGSFQKHEADCNRATVGIGSSKRAESPVPHRKRQPLVYQKPDHHCTAAPMARQHTQTIKAIAASTGRALTRPSGSVVVSHRSTVQHQPQRGPASLHSPVEPNLTDPLDMAMQSQVKRKQSGPSISVHTPRVRKPRQTTLPNHTTRQNPRPPASKETHWERQKRPTEQTRKVLDSGLHSTAHGSTNQIPRSTQATIKQTVPVIALRTSSTSADDHMEQSMRDQLTRWRSSRLGFRDRRETIIHGVGGEHMANLVAEPLQLSVNAPDSSRTSTDHMNFASVHPGPPPPLVERAFDEENSSVTDFWTQIMQSQPTLQARPSTPTPAGIGRLSTVSEYSSTLVMNPVQTDAVPAVAVAPSDAIRPSSHMPSTACAGDEVMYDRHVVLSTPNDPTLAEEDNISGPTIGRSPTTSSRIHATASTSTTVPLTANQRSRLTSRRPPKTGMVKPKPPSRSNTTTASTAVSTDLGSGQGSREVSREDQARYNRMRVKEFDRLRRVRTKHAKPTTR